MTVQRSLAYVIKQFLKKIEESLVYVVVRVKFSHFS